MLQIHGFGATAEVGKSCFMLSDGDHKIVLDAGVKIQPKVTGNLSLAPVGVDEFSEDLDAVILSHAHLDHSGYIPALYRGGYEGTIHLTYPTKDIAEVLWRDHLRIEGPYHYSTSHLIEARRKSKGHFYKQKFKVTDGISAQFFDAGHILGSASILLDWEGTRILYTGDINNAKTPFHDPVQYPDPDEPLDILITEATNGARPIPSRKEVTSDFIKAILRTYSRGGKVIIPSFALGRGQEIEANLVANFEDFLHTKMPLWVDGMITLMNEIHEKYFDEKWVSTRILDWTKRKGYKSPFRHEGIQFVPESDVRNKMQLRKEIAEDDDRKIILSTSGMMEGGPIHTYLRHAGGVRKNLLAIVGYQVEGTIGSEIETGKRDFNVVTPWNEEYSLNLRLEVERFNFSGHISPVALEHYTLFGNPQEVLAIHGNPESLDSLQMAISDSGYRVTQLRENVPHILSYNNA